RSVTVPGAVDGWLALHDRFGRLSLEAVLEPAVALAEEGFCASLLLAFASHLVAGRPGTGELCPGGPLEPGARVRLPGIARTLRAVAKGGRDSFYGGEFGRALLEVGGGVFEPGDLERDLATWEEPVALAVWDRVLWTVPPPSQGYLTLAGAWIAEQAGIGPDPDDPIWPHLAVEAASAAGFDRPAELFDGADGAALVAPSRLGDRARRIRPDRSVFSGEVTPEVAGRAAAGASATGAPATDAGAAGAGGPGRFAVLGDGDTTHLCAVDADGLGVSLTQSNALDFGSHLVAGSTGVFLHDRGVGFSLVEGHPAELRPGRRPPHTLSPMLVTDGEGRLTHLVGAMGGDAQPQVLLQLAARLLRSGEDPASAVAGARVSLEAPAAGPFRLWWGERRVNVEAHAPEGWAPGLAARGHEVRPVSAFDPVAVGCAQVIHVEPPPGSGGGVEGRASAAPRGIDGRADRGAGQGGGEGEGRAPSEERAFVGAADPRSPDGAAIGR
ncbi:MAG TPA: gamma-glutamyltransferase, partial [Acidimicrobiales bacterium]|nr:gamma-glutamyltransferase [Acidimicrobiales bacterium]